MNLEQLNAMTDEQLDEACAFIEGVELILDNKKIINRHYHPTANTTEGKAQLLSLMIKYKITPDYDVDNFHRYICLKVLEMSQK